MDDPGSLRYLDSTGRMAWLPPPPNDGQRYLVTYDFAHTRPAWIGLGGFGVSYGSNFGGGLT